MPLSLSNSVLPSTLLKNFVLMRLCFMRGYLFGKTGFLQDTKKSMGDNLVHAQGPEKTRKNQTSYAHAKSADIRNLFTVFTVILKFLRF